MARKRRQTTHRWTQDLRMGDHVLHLYRDDQERERVVADTFSWLPKGREDARILASNGKLPSHLSERQRG